MGAYLTLYLLAVRIRRLVLTDPMLHAFGHWRHFPRTTLDEVTRAYSDFASYADYRAWLDTASARMRELAQAVPAPRTWVLERDNLAVDSAGL